MNSPQRLLVGLFAAAILLAVDASVASACGTCKLGRGMPDTYSNGLLQVGGVGADPMHAGVSFDADDLRAEMSASANEATSETSYIFGLNTGVQMNRGLEQSNLASYDPFEIGDEASADEAEQFGTLPGLPPMNSARGSETPRIELADTAEIVITDPMQATRPSGFALVPEPASLALLMFGLAAFHRRRIR